MSPGPKGGEALINPWSDPRNPHGGESGDLIALGFVNWRPAMEAISATAPLGDVDPGRYASAWVVGGMGPVFDLAEDGMLRDVLLSLWEAGKPIAAICHGSIALARLEVAGGPLVSGQEVTGYSKQEDLATESMVGRGFRMPRYVEDELLARGALYRCAGPQQSLVVRGAGGRLLTGQNPQSADTFGRALAELIVT